MRERNKLLLVGVCLLTFCLNGCAPLKRKFTRKKKKDKVEKFIPVLDPIDYPAPSHSAQERYAYHYSLWRVWSRDLLQTFDRKEARDKNQKYLLGQMLEQLKEMKKWISPEKEDGLNEVMEELRAIQDLFAKPVSLRNKFSIKKKLERNARKIRYGLKPEK